MSEPRVRSSVAWLAVLSAGLFVTTDSGTQPPVAWVGFLGNQPAAESAAYMRFRDAVHRLGPQANARIRVRYHLIPVHAEERRMHEGVRAAMETTTTPSVMIASTGWLAHASVAFARPTRPVVFSSHVNPVANGIVDSMRTSHRAVTGVSMEDALDAKRIELLRDASPNIRRVAVLAELGWQGRLPLNATRTTGIHAVSGIQVTVYLANSPAEVDATVARALAAGVDAWYVPNSYLAALAGPLLIARLNATGLPAIYATPRAVAAGAPMSYWQDGNFVADALATLAWRVVQGEPAGSIPVERAKRLVLEVRATPDASGGWTPSAAMVRRADVVHE